MDLNDLVFYLGKVVPFWIIVEDGKMFGFGFEGWRMIPIDKMKFGKW